MTAAGISLPASLAALKAASTTVRAHVATAEAGARWPAPILDVLLDQRLFRLWLPRNAGGDELDLMDSLALMEASARIEARSAGR